MDRLARIANRYRALLKVNETAVIKPTIHEIFHGMCAALGKVLAYDRARLTLNDPDHDSLKIAALYGAYKSSVFQVGYLLPRMSSHDGWTFEHQTAMIRGDLAKRPQFPTENPTLDEGYRSLCSVPLIIRGNSIGVVTVVGAHKNQFSTRHARFLQEMSNQIAMAIGIAIPRCAIHPNTTLVCPRCIGAAGGKTTVSKHREDLSKWGKRGGRGRKNADFN